MRGVMRNGTYGRNLSVLVVAKGDREEYILVDFDIAGGARGWIC